MLLKVMVLGGGPGGYVAAIRCAQLGAAVTLVENKEVGGTCLNRGCIPSKILKTTADHLEAIDNSGEFGIEPNGKARLNMDKVMARKERILQLERRGIEALLRRHRVSLVQGHGRIEGHGKLSVQRKNGQRTIFSWDRLIIAAGSCPACISAFPFDGRNIISSNDALSLTEIPDSLVIVGGGVIGCEFASIFSSLGSRVTLVEALDRLLPLPLVDEDCSKTLQREMKKRGIKFYVNHLVEAVTETEKELSVHLNPSSFNKGNNGNEKPVTLKTSKVLVCVGRGPQTEDLGLETLGVKTEPKGWIQANTQMATNVPNVYAIGDVLGPEKVMLAHVASVEGIAAAENSMGNNREMGYNVVPAAIFTTPEVADVGLTETQAHAQGRDVRTDSVLFRTNSKAHVIGKIGGQTKIISDKKTGEILGVHMIGPNVTDLIGEGTLAVQMGCTLQQLSRTIHAHPTLSEIMLETSYKILDVGIHG